MAREMTQISLEEFATDIRRVFERVARGKESLIVTDQQNLAAVITPVTRRPEGARSRKSAVDLDLLRGAAGTLPERRSWKEIREIAREDHLKAKYGLGE